MTDPVLTGVGDLTAETGDVLPDLYSGTFSYQGNDFSTPAACAWCCSASFLRSDRNSRLRLRRRA